MDEILVVPALRDASHGICGAQDIHYRCQHIPLWLAIPQKDQAQENY